MESSEEAKAASAGCITCHTRTDEATMHPSGTVTLGCATCHGGDPKVSVAAGLAIDSAEYKATTKKAHPQPRVSDLWKSAANPERAYTKWLEESQEYIQFVNPGDLRVVDKTCGTLPRGGSPERPHQHDDAPARCCGRRRSTTTAARPTRTRASARATRPTARRSGCRRSPRRRRRRRRRKAGCRSSSRCRGGRSRSRATCCARSSAAAARRPRSAIRPGTRSPAGPTSS